MKKILWPWLMLAPMAVWAQSDTPPAPPDGEPGPAASVSASGYMGSAGAYHDMLAQLRDKLALTPEQQPLWRAYEAKVDAYNGQYYRERPVQPSAEEAATQQFARLVQNQQNRLAALEELEQAARTLYAGLNAEQQKTANQLLLATVPTFGGGGGRGGPTADSRRTGGERPRGGMGGGGMGGGGMGGGWNGGRF